jgi:hypothetical protein
LAKAEIITSYIGLSKALALNHSFFTQSDFDELSDQRRRTISDFDNASAISLDQSDLILDLSRHILNLFSSK